MTNANGKHVTHKLGEGESERVIASRMTKAFRLARLGKDAGRVNFNRPLNYPKLGWM